MANELKTNEGPIEPSVAVIPSRLRSLLKTSIAPLVGVTIAAISFFVLWELLKTTSRHETMEAFRSYSGSSFFYAILFTAISYCGIALYDVVAARTIAPGKIAPSVAALAGSAGYAVSNALGFSFLTGGALRYRVYAGEGVGIADIGRIISMSWFSMWFALLTIIGFALIFEPENLPWIGTLNITADRIVGIFIACALIALIVWLYGGARNLKVGPLSLKLPGSRGATLQIIAGLIDVIAASATLYVLMPADIQTGFAAFTLVYAIAIVIGVASHAPGGLGAFEAVLIGGLGLAGNPHALAALLIYRLIYTILPLIVAVFGMTCWELLRQRKRVSAKAAQVSRIIEPMIPLVSAGLTFLAGVVMLISVVTPGRRIRLDVLSDILPLIFIETSNLVASLIGVTLLIVSYGLARRLANAWFVTTFLLLIGAVFCLTKGLDWEEATILCVFCAILWVFRQSFYRRPLNNGLTISWAWLASIATLGCAVLWLGFFLYRHVEYSNELWWSFAWNANAPRFLRASVVIFSVIVIVAVYNIIHRPVGKQRRSVAIIPDCIPNLVAQSPLSDTALALLGDKQFLVSPNEDGFIMYSRSGGSMIALGEPVSNNKEVINELAWEFRKRADSAALRTVFYGVGPAHLPLYLDMGLSVIKLGEVAKVYLPDFSLDGPKRQPFRYAERKAEREGLKFSIIPAHDVENHLVALRHVSDTWMVSKAGAEKRFSIGYFNDDFLKRYDVAVMIKDDQIVAFANVWKSGQQQEITVDMMRYLPNVSKIMMDALFAHLMLYGKEQGFQWFNLGAAPLAGLSANRLAARWHRIGSFIYRRGRDLYHFDGLKTFKDKFDPVWTPHYLICPGGLDTAKVLIDVTTLINGNPLEFLRK
ncbi:bifunctional lysylphosphatidylglycerol flippase/synthetase MprF [Bartonella sp. LJL80]